MGETSSATKALSGLLALLLLALSCGGSADSARNDPEGETEAVEGFILNVESSSLLGVESLTVESTDGMQWEFDGRGAAVPGFTPSHLRDHMLLGLPVRVLFRREGDDLVIVGIQDAFIPEDASAPSAR